MRPSFLLFLPVLFLPVQTPAASLLVDRDSSSLQARVTASPPHSFEARVTDYEASIRLDSDGGVEAAEVSFLFAAVDTGNEGRDKKMLKWMDPDAHPRVSFTLKEVAVRDGVTVGLGELAIHGLSREVEVPFELTTEGDVVTLKGGLTIDYRDWSLDVIRMLFFTVRPELEVSFKLVGSLGEP